MSYPKRLRWHLARDVGLMADVRSLFLRALWSYLRGRARQLGFDGQPGAICFEQRFSSALTLNPHLHVLVAEGLFGVPTVEGAASFQPLPPPDDAEVEALLLTVATRTVRLMKKRGLLDDDAFPRSAHELTLAASLQLRLPFPSQQLPPRKRRCAFLEGVSLHANTHTHQNNRQGLELLCRYGARGALSLARLSRREDGRLTYRMKRAAADGSTQLVLTPLELTRRLAALVPPPRVHLGPLRRSVCPTRKAAPPCRAQTTRDDRVDSPSPPTKSQEAQARLGSPLAAGIRHRRARLPLRRPAPRAGLHHRSAGGTRNPRAPPATLVATPLGFRPGPSPTGVSGLTASTPARTQEAAVRLLPPARFVPPQLTGNGRAPSPPTFRPSRSTLSSTTSSFRART